jgi:hypothetical protein
VQGFDPTTVHIECGNDSDVVPGSLDQIPIVKVALAEVECKASLLPRRCKVAVDTYPHTKDPRAKKMLKAPSLLVPLLGKKPMVSSVCSVASLL